MQPLVQTKIHAVEINSVQHLALVGVARPSVAVA
jgi:hypothetical protein